LPCFCNVRFWHNDDFSFGISNREVSFFAVGALFYSDESTDLPGRKISGALHPDMTNNSISVYQKCPTARPRSPDHGRGGSLVDDQGFLWSSSSLNPAAQLTIESHSQPHSHSSPVVGALLGFLGWRRKRKQPLSHALISLAKWMGTLF
jgi:hypothetical protein